MTCLPRSPVRPIGGTGEERGPSGPGSNAATPPLPRTREATEPLCASLSSPEHGVMTTPVAAAPHAHPCAPHEALSGGAKAISGQGRSGPQKCTCTLCSTSSLSADWASVSDWKTPSGGRAGALGLVPLLGSGSEAPSRGVAGPRRPRVLGERNRRPARAECASAPLACWAGGSAPGGEPGPLGFHPIPLFPAAPHRCSHIGPPGLHFGGPGRVPGERLSAAHGGAVATWGGLVSTWPGRGAGRMGQQGPGSGAPPLYQAHY